MAKAYEPDQLAGRIFYISMVSIAAFCAVVFTFVL